MTRKVTVLALGAMLLTLWSSAEARQPLCIQFHELLQQYIGKSIEEIGDLEIGFLL